MGKIFSLCHWGTNIINGPLLPLFIMIAYDLIQL
jgi:hypothetical protein